MNFIKISITLLIFSLSTYPNPIDLFSTGAGSWIVIGNKKVETLEDNKQISYRNNFYFNKIYLNNYLTLGPLKGYIGFPLQIVIQDTWEDSLKKKNANAGIHLGDLNFWLGKKLNFIEPRIGLKLPLFYEKEEIWYGAGNIQAQFGFGLNANVRDDNKVSASGEIMYSIAIVDWSNSDNIKNAHARNGSFSLLPSFKVSLKPTSNFKIGMEFLGSFKRSKWFWLNENDVELSAGIVPNLYTETFFKDKIALSAKAGFGPSFKKEPTDSGFKRSGNSVNLSVGINLYP